MIDNSDALADAVALARRIAADPDAATDSDKLRTIADNIDYRDRLLGTQGTEAQDFLRGLALRLEAQS